MNNTVIPISDIAYPTKTLIKTVPNTHINSRNELNVRNTVYETTLYNSKGMMYTVNSTHSINYTVQGFFTIKLINTVN